MKMSLNRRQMLFASGAALMGAGPLVGRSFGAPRSATPKVLFFTKSSGYQHSVITRKDGQLSHAEKLLTMLGQHGGFEVVASKDGTMFDPDKIGQFDAFVFETTGILTEKGDHNDGPPMSADGKKAFLDAIAGGKGFVGMHCATDTFHSPPNEIDPYIKMIGGEFIVHGKQQVANLYVCDPAFPGAKAYPVEYKINDEWYAQKNLADDLHVVIAHRTKGMEGPMYQRPDFPQTWARMHDKGRVFYTSMGHREDVWENPLYHGLVTGAIQWALKKVDANVEPNIKEVTPEYNKIPS